MGAAIEFLMPILNQKAAQLIAAIKGACKRKRVRAADGLPLPLPLPLPLSLPLPLTRCARGLRTCYPTLYPFPRPAQVDTEDSLSFELDMAAIRRKKSTKKRLTAAEQERWDEHQADMELVEQFERKPLKSVQCGLGATFYEYNELAVQFGYITMFSVVLPLGAPSAPNPRP